MGIIVLTHITTDLIIIVPITGRTPGTAGIDIIAIVTPIITGDRNDRNSQTGLARTLEPAWTIFLALASPPAWPQDLYQAHQVGILVSIAESALVFPFVSLFRFAAGAIVRLFDFPECTETRTERALVNSAEGRSLELRRQLRAS